MANELMELSVTEQDISNLNHILSTTQAYYPVNENGEPKIPVSEAILEGEKARMKRLQTRNLQMHRQSLDWDQMPKSQRLNVVNMGKSFLEEGNYQIGVLQKRWKRSTTYIRGQQRMLSPKNYGWIGYYLLKEPEEDYKVSSMYTQNIGEYYGRGDEYKDGTGKTLSICINIILFLCWLMCLLFIFIILILFLNLANNKYNNIIDLFALVAMLSPFATGLVYTIWLKRKCKRLKIRRLVSRKVTSRLHERVPDFCLEKFLGILNSKVLRLIYADEVEDVGTLISCDMTGFMRDHANVVNCELQNFWFIDLREDKDYMYLDMSYRVFLDRDWGDQIGFSTENIVLQLARPLQGIMQADFYQDWSVVKIETYKK